jgi:hypothetical protein
VAKSHKVLFKQASESVEVGFTIITDIIMDDLRFRTLKQNSGLKLKNSILLYLALYTKCETPKIAIKGSRKKERQKNLHYNT